MPSSCDLLNLAYSHATKNLHTAFSLVLSPVAWAGINAADGLYVGGQLVAGRYKPAQGAAFLTSNSFALAVGFRPYIGYHFDDYLALESGYMKLVNNSQASHRDRSGGDFGPDHYRLSQIDFAGKAIYPFQNGLSLYGKLGVAYVHQDVYNQMFLGFKPSVDTNTSKFLPLIGAGVSYNFTQHLACDFSFTHTHGIDPIGDFDLLGLGLSYTF